MYRKIVRICSKIIRMYRKIMRICLKIMQIKKTRASAKPHLLESRQLPRYSRQIR